MKVSICLCCQCNWNGLEQHFVHSLLVCFCLQLLCLWLISPGRTADEEDWRWGGQTYWVWDEHCISPSWSANYEGNSCNPQSMTTRRFVLLHLPRQQLRQRFSQYSIFLQVSWRDIAGLDEIINELQDTVILPFQKRHLLAGSKLFQPPKGTTACHINRTITAILYCTHVLSWG